MSFFKKNPNEVAFVGQKKHWTDVIKCTAEPYTLLWKQPEEDFNTNSTLVVMPGETAIFVHAGEVEQVFTSGTYKLTTENYPFISRLRTAFSGGISTFNCVVYYVREAHSREILWGIVPAIQVRDPEQKIMCKLRANGAYRISICDPVKFLKYMVGSNKTSFRESEIQDFLGSEFQMHIKTLITQFIKSSNAEVLGICEYQVELSYIIKPFLIKILENYGIRLESFSIASLDIPDDDPNRAMLETAYSQHASMKVLGEDWARLESAKILEKLSENPGAGGIASMGAGMGMGMAAAPIFSSLAQQMFGGQPVHENPSVVTPPSPFSNGFGDFTSKPVTSSENTLTSQTSSSEFDESIRRLKKMKDTGMISQEQYDAKISEILNRM